MMEIKEYKNDFFDRAEAHGEARGKTKALTTVLGARNLEPSSEQRELIDSCRDLAQFDTWITRAATATTADEVFKD